MSSERSIWQVRVTFRGTEEQADGLAASISEMLCPHEEEHPLSECPMPGNVRTLDESALSKKEIEIFNALLAED
ncbi:hypothetical protein [Nocardia sp. X0981]